MFLNSQYIVKLAPNPHLPVYASDLHASRIYHTPLGGTRARLPAPITMADLYSSTYTPTPFDAPPESI